MHTPVSRKIGALLLTFTAKLKIVPETSSDKPKFMPWIGRGICQLVERKI